MINGILGAPYSIFSIVNVPRNPILTIKAHFGGGGGGGVKGLYVFTRAVFSPFCSAKAL